MSALTIDAPSAAMLGNLLRAPLVFQAARSVVIPHHCHLKSLGRIEAFVSPTIVGPAVRTTSSFSRTSSRNAWTSTPTMAAPAGEDFQGRGWKDGEAHEVLPKVFLGSVVRSGSQHWKCLLVFEPWLPLFPWETVSRQLPSPSILRQHLPRYPSAAALDYLLAQLVV